MSKKNPFEDLSDEFKDSLASMDETEIRKRIAQIALDEHENRALKAKDEDLKEKQAAVKYAAQQYSDATKSNKLKISYAHFILEGQGKV